MKLLLIFLNLFTALLGSLIEIKLKDKFPWIKNKIFIARIIYISLIVITSFISIFIYFQEKRIDYLSLSEIPYVDGYGIMCDLVSDLPESYLQESTNIGLEMKKLGIWPYQNLGKSAVPVDYVVRLNNLIRKYPDYPYSYVYRAEYNLENSPTSIEVICSDLKKAKELFLEIINIPNYCKRAVDINLIYLDNKYEKECRR